MEEFLEEEYEEAYNDLLKRILTEGSAMIQEVCPRRATYIIENLIELPKNPSEEHYWKELFEDLYMKIIGLYAKCTLLQYSVRDEDSIPIISQLTNLSPEELQEMRRKRYEEIRESMNMNNLAHTLVDAVTSETREKEEAIPVQEDDIFGYYIKQMREKKKEEGNSNSPTR